MRVSRKLRAFLARVLGWSDERAVELAIRSLALALGHRATLVLRGEGDMVPIAQALHRRALGPDKPFIVCDPRRLRSAASVRSPASRASGLAAFEAATGGTLCLRARRLPDDFSALVARLRGADDVLCVLCTGPLADSHPQPILPAPLVVPSLAGRAAVGELAGRDQERAEPERGVDLGRAGVGDDGGIGGGEDRHAEVERRKVA